MVLNRISFSIFFSDLYINAHTTSHSDKQTKQKLVVIVKQIRIKSVKKTDRKVRKMTGFLLPKFYSDNNKVKNLREREKEKKKSSRSSWLWIFSMFFSMHAVVAVC